MCIVYGFRGIYRSVLEQRREGEGETTCNPGRRLQDKPDSHTWIMDTDAECRSKKIE
jgi:hypothetical protein